MAPVYQYQSSINTKLLAENPAAPAIRLQADSMFAYTWVPALPRSFTSQFNPNQFC